MSSKKKNKQKLLRNQSIKDREATKKLINKKETNKNELQNNSVTKIKKEYAGTDHNSIKSILFEDLESDNLKPFPQLSRFELPDWIPTENYGDLLSICNFFYAFSKVLNQNSYVLIPFSKIAFAVMSDGMDNVHLVDIFQTLLQAKTECADLEDGDEANLIKSDQLGKEANCDALNEIHGQRIMDINKEHERLRICLGNSIRHQKVTSSNITEIIRCTLRTSGYFPIKGGNYKQRGSHCYEDPGYIFVIKNADLMKRLKTISIFELTPEERVKLIKVFIDQLLTYQKFRSLIDSWQNSAAELIKQINPNTSDFHNKFNEYLEYQALLGPYYMGQDRAFRSYYFMHFLSIIVVEEPDFKQLESICKEATPFEVSENLNADNLIACTGENSQNCPAHRPIRKNKTSKFLYLLEENGIENMLSTLNQNGIRESELLKNFVFLEKPLKECERILLQRYKNSKNILRMILNLPYKLNTNCSLDIQWQYNTLKNEILKIEEMVNKKKLGAPLIFPKDSRLLWQNSLLNTNDTSLFCVNNEICLQNPIAYGRKEILFSSKQINNNQLTEIQKLVIACLQVFQGINIDSLMDPFIRIKLESREQKVPTLTYTAWQCGLAACESVSAVFLFLGTLESSLKKIRLLKPPTPNSLPKHIQTLRRNLEAERLAEEEAAVASLSKCNEWESTRPNIYQTQNLRFFF